MPRIGSWKRQNSKESNSKPYIWRNNRKGIGNHSYCKVWVKKQAPDKYLVLKDQVDDSGRHQHQPTTLSHESSKEDARKAATEWMRTH